MIDRPTRKRRLLATSVTLMLALSGCGAGGSDGANDGDKGDVQLGAGVTREPCPDGDPGRGCIYLGTLSDLTEGPFAALGVQAAAGEEAFWTRVNEQGGIGGEFDVNVKKYLRDNKYNPQAHVSALREIAPNIAAVAFALGTPPTLAGLSVQDQNDLVSNAGTLWSGWAFDDQGLITETGASYCTMAMNALDFAAEEYGNVRSVLAVGYPGDYGGDSAAGAEIWGETNDVEVTTLETAPNAAAGNQDAVLQAIRRENPDVVVLSTGPNEMAEIVGSAVADGYDGRFMGSLPTWNSAVLKSEAGAAIRDRYRFVYAWAPFGTADTPAHKAMMEATGGKPPGNEGFTLGWGWQYPLRAILETAHGNGDLSPAGIRDAVAETTVDYEGLLPDRRYTDDPDQSVVRESLVMKPDPRGPLGATMEKDLEAGRTVSGHKFTEACAGAG